MFCCVVRLYLNGIHKVILASENDYLIYFYSIIIDARNEVKLERFNLVSCARIIFRWRRMSREISMNQYHIDWKWGGFFFWIFFSSVIWTPTQINRSACYIPRSSSLPRPTFWAIQHRILLSKSWFLHFVFNYWPQIFMFEGGSDSQ